MNDGVYRSSIGRLTVLPGISVSGAEGPEVQVNLNNYTSWTAHSVRKKMVYICEKGEGTI